MAFTIGNKYLTSMITRNLNKAQAENNDALEKLSSGTVFSRLDPRPAERALAEGLEFKLRSLNSSKRNINDAVSLMQTAESGLEEINNMILRMKEINLTAANTIISDKDRKYLFLEFEALRDEIDRVAESTTFNGLKLLNGDDENVPDQLVFRLGDPQYSDLATSDEGDINLVKFEGLKSVVATATGLGIPSARSLINGDEAEGVSLDDVIELMEAHDTDNFTTIYDESLHRLTSQRAIFGSLQSRMRKALDYIDVYEENVAAAKSSIADTDYASEVSKMTSSKILINAGTSMLVQANMQNEMMEKLLQNLG